MAFGLAGAAGFASGFGQAFNTAQHQAKEMQLRQQQMQMQQQRELMARADSQRKEVWDNISDHIKAMQAAGNDSTSIMNSLQHIIPVLERFTKSSGHDASLIAPQLSMMLDRPSSYDIALGGAGGQKRAPAQSQPSAFDQGGAAPTPFATDQGQPSAVGQMSPLPQAGPVPGMGTQLGAEDFSQQIDSLTRAMALAENPGLKDAYGIRLREAVKRQMASAGDHIEAKELNDKNGNKHVVFVNKRNHTVIDELGNPWVYPEGGGRKQETAKKIAQAIKEGRQPPVLTSLYGQSAEVRSALEDEGVDLTTLSLEYQKAQQQVRSLNGQRMTTYVGLAGSVLKTIDEVKRLSKDLDQGGVTWGNYVDLQGTIKNFGNTPRGQLASQYVAAVNVLRGEMANLESGGYAPTESSWKTAFEQANENYGKDELESALGEVQRLIRYRVQSIPNLYSLGPGRSLRYNLPGQAPPWQQEEGGGEQSPPAAAPQGGLQPTFKGRTKSGLEFEVR